MNTQTLQKWETTTLGKIADITSSKRIFASDYVDRGIPFYRSREIIEKQEEKDISTKLYISTDKYESIKNKFGVPKQDDILITSVGTLGVPYIVKASEVFYFKDGNLIWLRDFRDITNPKFIYYTILNPETQQRLKGISIGSSQSAFTISALKNFPVLLPDVLSQKQIADILSAYDNLIKNNTRRIQILEQLAQAIYIEWFVKFRFPGYEKVKMVDSGTDFGKIPEGWEVKKIGEIFSVKYGKNLPKTTITESGKFPVYGAGGVIGFYSEKNINDKTALITSRGNGSGTVWRTKGSGFVTNNSFSITGKDWYSYFNMSLIYNLLLSANIRSSISGSAQPQVTINSLNYVEVLVPEKSIAEIFQNEAMYLYDLSDRLFMTNQNLRQTRDLLLPRLVTGEIKV